MEYPNLPERNLIDVPAISRASQGYLHKHFTKIVADIAGRQQHHMNNISTNIDAPRRRKKHHGSVAHAFNKHPYTNTHLVDLDPLPRRDHDR